MPPSRGRPSIRRARPGPLAVRGTPAELDALVGQRVASIRRRGKFLLLDLDRDAIASTRCSPGACSSPRPARRSRPRPPSSWRSGRARAGRRTPRAWTRGASWLRPDDAAGRGPLQGPDPDGQGLPAAGRRRPADPGPRRGGAGPGRRRSGADPGHLARPDPQAPGRAQEPAAEPVVRGRHRQRLQRRDPACRRPAAVPQAIEPGDRGGRRALSGHARDARRRRSTILRERVPPTFEKQVRDFLAVHDKGGQPCPRCGTRITEVKAGGFITSYCRGCQH